MSTPRICVLMPVFNGEQYLRESIDSIINQSVTDFEFLIIDDNSNDNTKDILATYNDKRIRIIRNKSNLGLTKSLNVGIRETRAELIARMDADDIADSRRLEKQVFHMQKWQCDLVWSTSIFIDEDGNKICNRFQPSEEFTIRNLHRYNFIVHPSVVFRKTKVVASGMYDERFRTAQDWDLWRRMKANSCIFGLVNEVLIKYRISPVSISSKKLKYSPNISYRNAKLSLKNRDKLNFWKHFHKVGFFLRAALVLRLVIGERVLLFLEGNSFLRVLRNKLR